MKWSCFMHMIQQLVHFPTGHYWMTFSFRSANKYEVLLFIFVVLSLDSRRLFSNHHFIILGPFACKAINKIQWKTAKA